MTLPHATACRPRAASSARPLAPLSDALGALAAASARGIGDTLRSLLPDDRTLLGMLSPPDREGSPSGYTRHLVYADPMARFSAMLLVWRPGQASPVHGHRTWCAYRVLEGRLHERHYRWDAAAGLARHVGGAEREAGDLFTVPAGLGHIHALGNESEAVAVSLHVYGVSAQHIATGVNLLVENG